MTDWIRRGTGVTSPDAERNYPRVVAALKVVEDVLLSGNDMEARMLWDILTALRGPDFYIRDYKERTTNRVRAIAFPAIPLELWYRVGATVKKDGRELSATDLEPIGCTELDNRGERHFRYHLRAAVSALRALGRRI